MKIGDIIQLKDDNAYVGIIEEINIDSIRIRYIRINRELYHSSIGYKLNEFIKYWNVLN
jgi:hypothetical protein